MAISVLDVKLLLQYLLVFQIGALAHFQLCLQEHSFTLLKEERKKKDILMDSNIQFTETCISFQYSVMFFFIPMYRRWMWTEKGTAWEEQGAVVSDHIS